MTDTSKRLAKGMARPVLGPLLARIAYLRGRIEALDVQVQQSHAGTRAVEARLGAVEQQYATRLDELAQQHAATRATVEEYLDAINRQNALARQTRREQLSHEEAHRQDTAKTWQTQTRLAENMARLETRMEFIRNEVMLEIQRGAGTPGEIEAVEPQIIDQGKFQQRPLRLNLGCGHIPLEGYVNVDSRQLPGVDVVAEVGRLPVDPGEVAEIRSSHLLEHFPPVRLEELLQYWFGLLQPGGMFVAVVPDAESMIRTFMTGGVPWSDLKEVTFGGQEYAGDFHYTMFSQSDLTTALSSAGFVDVKIAESGRRNGASLEMEAVATKPEAG